LPIFLRVTVFSLDVMTDGFGKVMHRKKIWSGLMTECRLTDLPPRLRSTGYTDVPGYFSFWRATASGKLPWVRRIGGRYAYKCTDEPAIAAAMGLTQDVDETA
jgi:hypothetical protein